MQLEKLKLLKVEYICTVCISGGLIFGMKARACKAMKARNAGLQATYAGSLEGLLASTS